jgi:hypothetical protein
MGVVVVVVVVIVPCEIVKKILQYMYLRNILKWMFTNDRSTTPNHEYILSRPFLGPTGITITGGVHTIRGRYNSSSPRANNLFDNSIER